MRMAEIWFSEEKEMPVGVRRSVDVKMRIRKRPAEGKSRFMG